MMKLIFNLMLAVLLGANVMAQENVFLHRDYWKAKPTLEQVKADINKGNSPTELTRFMFDAPAYAILEKTDLEILKYLIGLEGNGVDKITHDGRKYLHWAGYVGEKEVIDWLIKEGSDVNHIDEHGYGLVTFTAVGGNTDPAIYEMYIAQGLSLLEKNRDGANVLLLASSGVNSLDELSYFLDNGLSLEDTDNHGNNIFLYAVSSGNVPFLKELVDAGVDYKALNNEQKNAVILAAQGSRRHSNNLALFSYLKTLKLGFKQKDKKGKTALHYAAYRNPNKDVLAFLIAQGVDPMALDHDGNPAIFNAVQYNNSAAIETLIPYVIDLEFANKKGETLMSKAIQGNNKEITKLLLDKNINVQHKDKNNRSYVYLLFDNYKDQNKAYFEETLDVLTQLGVQPTIDSEKHQTIYHIAVDQNNLYLLDKAISLSKDINKKNKKGLTPLQLAALKARDVVILQKLIDAGADKTVTTEFDETVYDMAKENEALQNVNVEFLK